MTKIAFLGAGSLGFGRRLVADILSFPELREVELALVDPVPERVDFITGVVERLIGHLGLPTRISRHVDRAAALDGADYVIASIRVGDHEVEQWDIRVPLEVGGLRQTVADTLGIGGVMKSLRTVPVMLEIARDMERRCPDAVLLNYTNPMATIMWAVQEATRIRSVGLCHSVQHTSKQLAGYLGVDYDRLRYRVAGINHMAWFLELAADGQDLYPALRASVDRPEIYAKDRVRFEMMRHFGYFVTESSRHMSEYVPYFLPHDRMVEALELPYSDEAALQKRSEHRAAAWEKARRENLEAPHALPERSNEYGARILHSLETGTPRCIHGNVLNRGLIPNLKEGACVEVPVLCNRAGLQPCHFGPLPPQLAALCTTNILPQELIVRAILEERREHVFHAAMLDPNTAAQLSLPQIRASLDRLLDLQQEYMPPLH